MFRLLLVLSLLTGICASAHAQNYEQLWNVCKGDTQDEQTLSSCSAVISSGQVRGKGLALALINRGVVYDHMGQHDRAIRDFDQAVKLAPDLSLAFLNRGVAYLHKGAFDEAIRNFDEALKSERHFLAFFNRGMAYFYKGQYERAIRDFYQALKEEL